MWGAETQVRCKQNQLLLFKSEFQKDMSGSHFTSNLKWKKLAFSLWHYYSRTFKDKEILIPVMSHFYAMYYFLYFVFGLKYCKAWTLQQMQTPSFMMFVSCKDIWTPEDIVMLYLLVLGKWFSWIHGLRPRKCLVLV